MPGIFKSWEREGFGLKHMNYTYQEEKGELRKLSGWPSSSLQKIRSAWCWDNVIEKNIRKRWRTFENRGRAKILRKRFSIRSGSESPSERDRSPNWGKAKELNPDMPWSESIFLTEVFNIIKNSTSGRGNWRLPMWIIGILKRVWWHGIF